MGKPGRLAGTCARLERAGFRHKRSVCGRDLFHLGSFHPDGWKLPVLTPLLMGRAEEALPRTHAAVLWSVAPSYLSVSLDSRTAEQTRAEACRITIQEPSTPTQSLPRFVFLLSLSDEAVMSGDRLIHLSLPPPSIKLLLLYLTLSYSVSPRHSGCVESNSQNYNPWVYRRV